MTTVQTRPPTAEETVRVGQLTAAVILTWIVFALLADLEPNGLHLLVLGALRVVLFAALLAFAVRAGATRTTFGRASLALTATMAVSNLVGGAGAVVTDGWSYNPFDASVTAAAPWYGYVSGGSALLFALGTVLVGVAGRRAGWLAAAVVAAGAVFPLVFFLGEFLSDEVLSESTGELLGHLIWVGAWLALALGLAMSRARRA